MPDSDKSDAPPGWSAAYEAHAARMHRMAILLVGHDDADDLVTDAVQRAVSSRRWPTIEQPGAYLTRTLIHLATDRRRATSRRIGRERRTTGSDRVESRVADIERKLVVAAALGSLSASQLAVVYLRYWEDMTLQQVASHLNIRVGSASTHLDRAKRRLRIELASAHQEGDQP